uniref:Uncharacterized protein n=2 Tax=Octopus bimaculoides TaxID=37653 RepID=A0A0L8FP51_OCTBM
MGAGSKVYDSFLKRGSPSSWNVDKCIGTFCPNFFRHPLLDFWNHLPIDEVKLVIYKNQTSVVNIVFDGQSSTLENWFSLGKLKSSPWPDIPQSPVYMFSMAGFLGIRRFYIASEHSGCDTDRGWLTVIESYQRCTWQIFPNYPRIVYSEGNSRITWFDGYAEGDSMAIFIRLKSN